MTAALDLQGTESILDAMHAHVLRGEYAELASLLPALERGTFQLGEGNPVAGLQRLKDKAARNAACLESAITGIRAGQRRLSEIALAERGLSTYDRSGGKHLLDSARNAGLRF